MSHLEGGSTRRLRVALAHELKLSYFFKLASFGGPVMAEIFVPLLATKFPELDGHQILDFPLHLLSQQRCLRTSEADWISSHLSICGFFRDA